MSAVFISFCRCPVHGFECISVDGPRSGQRITEGKCCGRWDEVKRWKISSAVLKEAAEFAETIESE